MHKYIVESANQITPSTLLITLGCESENHFLSFQPGQYAAISFKNRRRPTPARCFSIVSSPTEQGKLQFSMRTKGRFTKALTKLKKGDVVKVRGPYGGFVFNAERDKNTLFIAGGIGITPFVSMIRFASSNKLINKITLIYSCQSQEDIPFKNELIELQKRNPNFKVIFLIGDGPTDKLSHLETAKGRVSRELLDKVTNTNYEDKTFFICGPPPFMKAVLKLLQDKGVPKKNLITEAFSQGPNRQTGKIFSWPLNMYIFSGIGILLGSFVVMVSDLLKTLPPTSLFDSSNINRKTTLTNSRQTDLDKLVNELPVENNTNPSTYAVKKALSDYQKSLKTSTQTGSTNGINQQPSTSSSQTTKSSTSTTTTTAPKPAPTPKCTTTQSGVTTCI